MSPEQTRNRETARAAPPPAGLLRLPQLLQQRDRLTLDPAREPRADGIETTSDTRIPQTSADYDPASAEQS